jgi:hypothetical protein
MAAQTAVVVTVATFAKLFVPFYLIGSTTIFVVSCFLGLTLIAFASRNLVEQMAHATDRLVLLILLYCTIVANFLINSFHRVPITHSAGVVALKCRELAGAGAIAMPPSASPLPEIGKSPA